MVLEEIRPILTIQEAEENPEENYGRDIFLNSNNDIVISTKQDLTQVSSVENLKQAIINKLRTQKGEISLNPNYGGRLQELIGTNANDLTLSTAKMNVREVLLQEPRIQEIVSITPKFSNREKTIIEIGIIVIPIVNIEPLNLVYPLFL